jgi:hypothetical protein
VKESIKVGMEKVAMLVDDSIIKIYMLKFVPVVHCANQELLQANAIPLLWPMNSSYVSPARERLPSSGAYGNGCELWAWYLSKYSQFQTQPPVRT